MPTQSAGARDRLIEAATELFVQNGFRSTPVDAIAAEAGVSRSLVFWHFDSKERLLWTVVTESLRGWIDDTRKATANLRGLAALRKHMSRRKTVIHDESASIRLCYLLLGEAVGDTNTSDEMLHDLRQLYVEARELMRRWVTEAVEDGDLPPDVDIEAVTNLIHAALQGIDAARFFEGDSFDAESADAGLLCLLGVNTPKRKSTKRRMA